VQLAAEMVPGKRLAAMVGPAEPTVATWWGRYAESVLAELEERPGPKLPLPEALRRRMISLQGAVSFISGAKTYNRVFRFRRKRVWFYDRRSV
jgi:hypothetical protein